MPALEPTDFYAEIEWLGYVPHRDEPTITTIALDQMPLAWGGFEPDHHSGVTRLACVRVSAQHATGTEIRNTRQLSILSAEELDVIRAEMGIDHFDPKWAGASIVLRGIPDFTHVPPSSRLQAENGTTLIVDMENRPCRYPAMTMEPEIPGKSKGFIAAAKGRRGVTASVERPGLLKTGDRMRLHIPAQRGWQPERSN